MKSLSFHRLESVFNPTTSSYPGSRQCLGKFDKVLVNFALPLSRTMFSIKITKLTAGAKNFVNDSHRTGLYHIQRFFSADNSLALV